MNFWFNYLQAINHQYLLKTFITCVTMYGAATKIGVNYHSCTLG